MWRSRYRDGRCIMLWHDGRPSTFNLGLTFFRGVAQLASVLAWGASGRPFESDHPDRGYLDTSGRPDRSVGITPTEVTLIQVVVTTVASGSPRHRPLSGQRKAFCLEEHHRVKPDNTPGLAKASPPPKGGLKPTGIY